MTPSKMDSSLHPSIVALQFRGGIVHMYVVDLFAAAAEAEFLN